MFLKRFLPFLLVSILLIACSDYNKLLKSSDYNLKLQKALEYYGKHDYTRAQALLEEVLPLFRTTVKGEEAYYKYCYCYYYTKDYYLAGYYFKTFTKFYPGSEKAEECLFMSGICNLKNSPRWSLDQTETYDAIKDFQTFLDKYPTSPRKDTCNKVIDNLRLKLEKKAFENAKLYYKIENYKSASIALKSMMSDFPSSIYAEEALYLILKADYEYATNSIDSKKKERFEQTIKSYVNFAARFPESEHKKEADRIYASVNEKLSALKDNK